MPPKKAVAEGATTRAQSSQSQSINDEVNDTEDLTSDVPALVATLTGHAMGDEIDQSNEHTEGEQDIVKPQAQRKIEIRQNTPRPQHSQVLRI